MSAAGTLFGVGVGPGDPELMTLKAARLLRAAAAIAWFARAGEPGHARRIADAHVAPEAEELRFDFPYTTEIPKRSAAYRAAMAAFYDSVAKRIAAVLDSGRDLVLLCEGDPLLYGSFMYVNDRLAARYRTEIVPGVTAMAGCWGRVGAPMARGDDSLAVLAGTMAEDALAERLGAADASVIVKAGRHLPKIRRALDRAGLLDRAVLVERGTMPGERILPVADAPAGDAPYFSLVLVPTARASS